MNLRPLTLTKPSWVSLFVGVLVSVIVTTSCTRSTTPRGGLSPESIRGSSNALMAARRLYAAWRRDDREAALDVGTSEAVAHLVGMNPRSSLTGPERCAVDGPSYVCKPRPSTSSSSLPRDVLLFVVQGDANGLRVTSTAIWEEESPGHYAIITTASASP